MDYEYFQSLSKEAARDCLASLLDSQRQATPAMVAAAAHDGVSLDFSLSSLPDAMKWMLKRVGVHRRQWDDAVPWWVQHTDPKGFIDFNDDSLTTLLYAGYYLGECFSRLPSLRWDIGSPDYMECNMPVVVGFRNALELPPLEVVENVFTRILGRGAPVTSIDSTLEVWLRDVPSRHESIAGE